MSLERLEKEIISTVSPLITSESMLNGVKRPNISFIDNIESPFSKDPIGGLYDRSIPVIILNRGQMNRLLNMGVDENEVKLTVIETCFHEFKHHVDSERFNMTPRVYSDNKPKWENRARKYARKMMGKYGLRAGW